MDIHIPGPRTLMRLARLRDNMFVVSTSAASEQGRERDPAPRPTHPSRRQNSNSCFRVRPVPPPQHHADEFGNAGALAIMYGKRPSEENIIAAMQVSMLPCRTSRREPGQLSWSAAASLARSFIFSTLSSLRRSSS